MRRRLNYESSLYQQEGKKRQGGSGFYLLRQKNSQQESKQGGRRVRDTNQISREEENILREEESLADLTGGWRAGRSLNNPSSAKSEGRESKRRPPFRSF